MKTSEEALDCPKTNGLQSLDVNSWPKLCIYGCWGHKIGPFGLVIQSGGALSCQVSSRACLKRALQMRVFTPKSIQINIWGWFVLLHILDWFNLLGIVGHWKRILLHVSMYFLDIVWMNYEISTSVPQNWPCSDCLQVVGRNLQGSFSDKSHK